MKTWIPSALLIFLASCSLDFHSDFCDALIENDVTYVRGVVDDIIEDLAPHPVAGDPWGHYENLETLVYELNRDDCVYAEIWCYACIESLPAQSEIRLVVEDGPYDIEKVIDIATPAGAEMYFVGMHD